MSGLGSACLASRRQTRSRYPKLTKPTLPLQTGGHPLGLYSARVFLPRFVRVVPLCRPSVSSLPSPTIPRLGIVVKA